MHLAWLSLLTFFKVYSKYLHSGTSFHVSLKLRDFLQSYLSPDLKTNEIKHVSTSVWSVCWLTTEGFCLLFMIPIKLGWLCNSDDSKFETTSASISTKNKVNSKTHILISSKVRLGSCDVTQVFVAFEQATKWNIIKKR